MITPSGIKAIVKARDFTDTTGPATDGYSMLWDNSSGKFVLSEVTGVSDHGALTGLADDDHTQYLLATGSRAGATSNRQEFTNGIGAGTAVFNADGTFYTGVTPTSQRYHGYIQSELSFTSGGSAGGLNIASVASPVAGSISFYGINCNSRTSGSNNTGQVAGGIFQANHNASGTLNSATGGEFSSANFGGTVTTQAAGTFNNTVNSGSTSTNVYGIIIAAPTGTGAKTTYRGIRVYNTTGVQITYGIQTQIESGTGKWNIYADGTADNYFNGDVGIGTTSPTAFLDVAASTTGKASLRMRSGTAPTSPNDGDIWQDGSDLLIRIGGTTYTLDKTEA